MRTAVEWYNQQIVDRQNGNGDSRSRDEIFEQAKRMEKEQIGYSKEDLFKILLDFVAFPHHDMEPRGSIIERYLNELSKKKFNN